MKLVIGGFAQGKLNTVIKTIPGNSYLVFDGKLPNDAQLQNKKEETLVIINHFHLWVREEIKQDRNPKENILTFLDKNKDCVIISDEIGNGIVPMDAFEREYRETTGRILIELADKADEVVRVICGIQQRIK